MEKKYIALVAAVVTVLVASVILWTYQVTIHNVGIIKAYNIGVYWDREGLNRCTEINWGTMSPQSSASVKVYLRNEGNSKMVYMFNTSSWEPPAIQGYMTLSWNYTGQTVQINQTVCVRFSFWVAADITGVDPFSFDITIFARDFNQ